MDWMLSLTISVTYAVMCLGWGLLTVQAFRSYRIKTAASEKYSGDLSILIASNFLAGTAVISAMLTVLGLIGQLRPLTLIFGLLPGAIGLVLARKRMRECMYAILDVTKGLMVMPLWLLLIGGFTVLLAIGTGVGALILPPKGDAAAFYMIYPKIIAATGLLEPMPGPFYYFSAIGLPVELHYAALMAMADQHAAKFFMFPIAVSVGVMLAGIVRLCGGGIAAVTLSWAMLFSSYTFHHYVYDGKVDLAAAAYGLAAVYWLLRGTESRVSVPACLLAGWFAGLATAAKFSYLLALGVSLFVLCSWQLVISRTQNTSVRTVTSNVVRAGVVMALAALFAWLPQLLKNGVLFDAPLAPFLGGQGEGNLLNQIWFSPEDTKKILLTYPFALVFGRYPMQGGGLSFLFLAFIPFVIWLPRSTPWNKSMTVAVTVAGFSGVLAWMLLRPSVIAPRYILASLLLFVPILAIATENVLAKKDASQILRTGATLTTLCAIVASFWHLLPIPGAVIAGISPRNNACLLASAECVFFQKLAEIARPGDRILIASHYPYGLTPSQLQCRDSLEEQRDIPGQEQLVYWLQSHGFDYVAVDPMVSRQLAIDLRQLAVSNVENVYELPGEKVLKLYRIKTDMPGSVRCVESNRQRWHLKKDLS